MFFSLYGKPFYDSPNTYFTGLVMIATNRNVTSYVHTVYFRSIKYMLKLFIKSFIKDMQKKMPLGDRANNRQQKRKKSTNAENVKKSVHNPELLLCI